MLAQLPSLILLVLGFGFVIFFHELGHFLAAKWVGIKVEQFAVGFGQAIFAWRKGIGFRLGSTQKEFRKRIADHVQTQTAEKLKLKEQASNLPTEKQIAAAARDLGLSE